MSTETNPSLGLSYTHKEKALAESDSGLVVSAQKGDLDAFEQLVAKHHKKMFNIAFRFTGDYDEACDIVQDVFVSAYKSIRTFRGEAKFSTWLTTITVNVSKNHLKKIRARSSHLAFSLDETIPAGDGERNFDPPSNKPSVLDEMSARDAAANVRRCIDNLEPEYREVVILRDMQDFSYREIEQILKVREGTVKSRLFRGREAVKDCLKKAMGIL